MAGAGRLGDKAFCPSDSHGCLACSHPVRGPAVQGSFNVFVNSRPALRSGDAGIHAACCGPNTWKASGGSATVFINGMPAHRMGDETVHCGGSGNLIEGSGNVFIGDGTGAGGSPWVPQAGFPPAEKAQREALIQAHEEGTPFCEICEGPVEEAERAVNKEKTIRKTAEHISIPFMEKTYYKDKKGIESDNANDYKKEIIKFEYSKIGYLMLEGIGINGSYGVKGYASIYPSRGTWLMDVTVNIRTAASQASTVYFSGTIELVVDDVSQQKVVLKKPKGQYIKSPDTFVYETDDSFHLPEKGKVEIIIDTSGVAQTPGGSAPILSPKSKKRIKIYEKNNK
jgi:uncharacterized Zn-binding protein involved in type VI secretion